MSAERVSAGPAVAQFSVAHLSENELDDLLIGAGTASSAAHLAGCAECAGRVSEFQAMVGTFNQASMAWSEAKSNTLTRDLTAGRRTPSRFGVAAAGSLTAAVMVAVVGVALSAGVRFDVWRGEPSGAAAPESAGQSANPDALVTREREIAGDNAMLQAIDMEISRPEPSPELVYSLDKAAPASDRRVSRAGSTE